MLHKEYSGQNFQGIPVYINDLRMVVYEKRTLRERCLSWPWKPWERMKSVPGPKMIPDGQILLIKYGGAYLMNSRTWETLKAKGEGRIPNGGRHG